MHWVPVDRTDNLLLVVALFLEIGDEDFGKFERPALTGAEVKLHTLALDAFEQRLDEFGRHAVAAELESERVNALVEHVEGLGIGFLCIGHLDVLADIPLVVVFLVAADERKLAWQSIRSLQFQHVFPAIERLHVETFVSPPYKLLVEVGAFQVNLNFVEPLLGRRRGKLGEEFFLNV